jgi:hypothetical protein
VTGVCLCCLLSVWVRRMRPKKVASDQFPSPSQCDEMRWDAMNGCWVGQPRPLVSTSRHQGCAADSNPMTPALSRVVPLPATCQPRGLVDLSIADVEGVVRVSECQCASVSLSRPLSLEAHGVVPGNSAFDGPKHYDRLFDNTTPPAND